ncbi:MAG: electron transfer flavoprotein subunit beta, partial [Nocardioidaceae bacterium]|nr:electron transfer flavoprotein subunit beta [Nocardioidaceae bacterium]
GSVDGDAVTIQRQADYGYDGVQAGTPAGISVVGKINEPRNPSFKGIMAAKKKPVETWSLADLGVDAGSVGLAAAWTAVEDTTARPPRTAGEVVKDDAGSGATALVEFLAAKKFI